MRRQHYDLSITPMPLVGYFDDDCRLPDDLEAIEAGRQPRTRQQELFDGSLMGKLRAIKIAEGER